MEILLYCIKKPFRISFKLQKEKKKLNVGPGLKNKLLLQNSAGQFPEE